MSVTAGTQIQAGYGLWTEPPTAFTYQWQSSPNGTTGWADITGETRSDYITSEDDLGLWFRVLIVAENAGGEGDATTDAVGPVVLGPELPVNEIPPSISGHEVVGRTLTADPGQWSNSPFAYSYQWQISLDGSTDWEDILGETDQEYVVAPGDEDQWLRVAVFAENSDGIGDVAYSEEVGPVTPVPSPNEDPMAPCTPWITGDDVADCCNVEVTSGVLFNAAADMASDLLFSISGRLFAGECERTVRPSCDECYCGYQILSRGYVIGPWDFGYPLMLCDSCMVSCDPSLVKLAGTPIREITEVKIDGDVVDPADYRIYNDRYLQRLDSEKWPHSQNLTLPDTEDHTFSITYTFGADPPPLGVAAAAQIACDIYKACSADAGDCQLPTGVTRLTRQGVTIDKLAFTSWGFREGRWATGFSLVDAFLGSVNPAGLQRRPVVWAPGKRQYAQPWGT